MEILTGRFDIAKTQNLTILMKEYLHAFRWCVGGTSISMVEFKSFRLEQKWDCDSELLVEIESIVERIVPVDGCKLL